MEESSAYILDIKRKLGLSTQLSMVLELLILKKVVRKDDLKPLFSTFHGDKPYHSVNRMMLYRLRKRLDEMNICIFSQYGEGYYIKVSDRAYLVGILEGVLETPSGLSPRRT